MFYIYFKRKMSQNALILLHCIHYKHYSVKIDFFYFFSSSDMQKFHQLWGCYANSLLIFFKFFTFFKFNLQGQKSAKNNSIRIIFLIISIIKINVIKICTKNTTTKLSNSSLKYSIFPSVYKAVKSTSIIFLWYKPIGNRF